MVNSAFAAELPSKTLFGHTDRVFAVAFSPADENILATAGADNTIRIWNVESGKESKVLEGHQGDVTAVVFSSKPLVLSVKDSTGLPLPPGPPLTVLASSSTDETIRLWNIETGEEILRFLGHSGEVRDIDFGPDGTRLVSGASDQLLKIWDVQTGRELNTLEGHEDTVLSVAFSPNGDYIASGSMDCTMRLWDAKTLEELNIYRGHEDNISSVDFSPDGKLLVSGSWDGTVRLWKVPDGIPSAGEDFGCWVGKSGFPECNEGKGDRHLLAKLETLVFSVEFSPDGKLIAAALSEQLLESNGVNTVRIWDVETGSLVSKMNTKPKFDVSFSPDEMTLAACGSSDANVIIWQSVVSAPLLLSPEEGVFIEDRAVELKWQDIIGAVYYEVEIAPDSNFTEVILSSMVVDETKFSYEPSTEAEYWWRVRTGGFGRVGDWSKPSMFVISAVPAERCVLKIEPVSQRVDKGDTFELVVSIENVKELAGFQFDLTFNPKILEVLSVGSVGELFTVEGMQPDIDNTSGIIKNIVAAKHGKGGVSGDGILLKASLKAIESGESEIKVENDILGDATGKPIEDYNIINVNVIVEEPLHPWDVTGDGVVNVLDLIFVGQYFDEEITEQMEQNPDVNRNGIVDLYDYILVGQHFGEEYDELPQAPPAIKFTKDYPEITRALLDIYKLTRNQTSPEFIGLNRLLEKLIQSTEMWQRGLESQPTSNQLGQNYPNPFNPETWIPYQLADFSSVVITVFDVTGKPVRTLHLGYNPPGLYLNKAKAAYWDGKNNAGETVASGLYFYSIQAGNFTAVRKMVVAR